MIYTIGWIIAAAVAILLFSVRVFVNLELSDELKLNIWAFGFKIRILPKKEKKYKISDYTPKKVAKREEKRKKLEAKKAAKKAEKQAKKKAKKAEQAKLTRAEKKAIKKQKKEVRPAIVDMIRLFTEITGLFFSTFFSHLHIKTSRLKIKVGGADAAQTALLWYGIYAACGALIALLDKYSNLHGKRRADICIEPDYLSEKIEADLKLSFSMNLFGLLCVLFKVAIKAISGWIGIKPQKTSTQHKTGIQNASDNNTTKQKGSKDKAKA